MYVFLQSLQVEECFLTFQFLLIARHSFFLIHGNILSILYLLNKPAIITLTALELAFITPVLTTPELIIPVLFIPVLIIQLLIKLVSGRLLLLVVVIKRGVWCKAFNELNEIKH